MLLAETITLTLQAAIECVGSDLPWDLGQRSLADERIAALQRLMEDRRLVLAAIDSGRIIPRAVLVRHGWLAVREALLNARDAPDSWDDERATRTSVAAHRGASWLAQLEIPPPAHA